MPDAGIQARATIVVTTRDRFALARESLVSLLENTQRPFDLIYVVPADAPRSERRWLADMVRQHNFAIVKPSRPTTPAEARNLGLAQAKTEYVVFVENDVVFEKGWLEALVACADDTGADVAGPLTCEGRPAHTLVHHVGAPLAADEAFSTTISGEHDFSEEFHLQGARREQLADRLTRRRTQWPEMHCFLTRRVLFDRVGGFDPDVVSKEYLDFAWSVRAGGGEIWFEPKAVVTFLVPSEADPVTFKDLAYFLLRWSRAWQAASHDKLRTKWALTEAGFIASRRALADWRILDHVVKPCLQQVPVLGRRWGFVERAAKIVAPVFLLASSLLAWRYAQARRLSEA